MPRGRSHRRSEAARRRLEVTRTERIGIQQPSVDFVPLGGTGKRHKVRKWEASLVTPHQHKLVIPDGSPDKQFILVIGASHLRSFADGIVRMPAGRFVFGFMSTPGAAANDLRLEVLNAEVSREPDAVCILATSNDLTASNTPEQAGQSFERYLKAVLSRWPKAFCMSMVPRLTEPGEKLNFYNQEFHHRAKRLGVSFTSIAEYYPRSRRQLWCRDGAETAHDRVLVCDVQRSPCPGETSEGPAAAPVPVAVAGAMPGGAAIQAL
ncbi:PREDICTED: uncharacterized protein LOC107104187 [Cyprinodon variegatus]|uniref:uncharacterized protein LOC107104187 n=1 Tax=Cyprinodon variegatus TaxID=28743 RepID=UPI000742C97A|nr:PREDICTED: uncharacterized protein LOC107104187 [Cyprinodon variegatus]